MALSQVGAEISKSRFQSFADVGGPTHGRTRIEALRGALRERGLTGFIVPRADRYQNEYVPPADERLLWLTGFSGSAGLAIVLQDKAVLFVDGRYTVQAAEQVDTSVVAPVAIADLSVTDWLEQNLTADERLGYDPWLHTSESLSRYSSVCAKIGARLEPVATNPIDAIWTDRPEPPIASVSLRPLKFAGADAETKIDHLRLALKDVDGQFVSDPHNISWLFNIRGGDVTHTPLPLASAYVPKGERPTLFIDSRKLSNSIRTELAEITELSGPEDAVAFLESAGRSKRRIAFDSATAPAKLVESLRAAGGDAAIRPDPTTLMKARKNEAEIAGARAAHIRDGAAVTNFLAWFEEATESGRLTEIQAAEKLEQFRTETGALVDIAFPTISAAGPHAASPHYRVSESSDRKIDRGFFLIDSGAQYEDGTTDITRTLSVGKPSRELRARFTQVLKGHIAIARAVFPKGTTGGQIDAFARLPLWRAGRDFDHGTGHGVGSFLSVHEGPQRIAKAATVSLEPGMILSNEPGYYAPGRFGIRIENLLLVTPVEIAGAEREMLGFETISLAPIDLRAIEPDLLDSDEIAWLDAYHHRVRRTISPLVDRHVRRWLKRATTRLFKKL